VPKIPIDISKGWLPDLSPASVGIEGGLTKAVNVYPLVDGYGPVKSLELYCDTINVPSGTILSMFTAKTDTDGRDYNFLVTTTHIYRFDSHALIDVTYKDKSPFHSKFVDHCVYGNWLITTNESDPPLIKKQMNHGDPFEKLKGNPPNARYCIISHGHLILGYLTYGGKTYQKQLMWSGKELVEAMDHTNPAVLATGADMQDIPALDGPMTGLANLGDGFAVFAERSISIAYYAGGAYRFAFSQNPIRNTGCFYPGSLISTGDSCFFWSKESIWELNADGVREIGKYLRKQVVARMNPTFSKKIMASHDPENGVINWTFAYDQDPQATHVLAYNYRARSFTLINLPVAAISSGAIAGDTWAYLNADYGYTVWSGEDFSTPHSYSTFDAGEEQDLLAATFEGQVKRFSGDNLPATVETGEVADPETVVCVNKIYLPIERDHS
jgi:hypothetical protein